MEINININNENLVIWKNKALDFIKRNILFIWLGMALGFSGLDIFDITWWIIMVPGAILNEFQIMWRDEQDSKSQDVLLSEES